MISEPRARAALLSAFGRITRSPTAAEVQLAQAVGRFEGRYGDWIAANNWGAIQCHQRPPCPPGCAEHTDHHADGSAYQACFRVYASPEAGALDLLHELYRRPGVGAAMRVGDALQMAQAMRASHYFEARPYDYAQAIVSNARAVATALGEPLYASAGDSRMAVGIVSVSAGLLAVYLARRWRSDSARPHGRR